MKKPIILKILNFKKYKDQVILTTNKRILAIPINKISIMRMSLVIRFLFLMILII